MSSTYISISLRVLNVLTALSLAIQMPEYEDDQGDDQQDAYDN